MKKKCLFILFSMLLFITMFFSNQNNVSAATLARDTSSIEKVSAGVRTDAKYSFSFKTSDKTTCKIWGYGGTVLNSNNNAVAVLPEDSYSGKMGCWIYNAGVYNNKAVDVKCTYSWEPVYVNGTNILPFISCIYRQSENSIPFRFNNHAYQVNFELYQNGKPLTLNMGLKFGDIDGYEYYGLKTNTGSINKIQCLKDATCYYQNTNGFHCFYADEHQGNNVEQDTIRFELGNTNSFTILYGANYDINSYAWYNRIQDTADWCRKQMLEMNMSNKAKFNSLDSTVANAGGWGYFMADAYGPYDTPNPVKTVSDTDEKDVTENTIGEKEEFTYNVSQTVPLQATGYVYSTMQIEDTLPDEVSYVKANVVDAQGKDVTGQFDIDVNRQTVRAIAKTDFLSQAAFLNNTYTLKITVKSNAVRTVNFVNKAKVTTQINGMDKQTSTTNEVKTKYETTTKRVKLVWDDVNNQDGIRPDSVDIVLKADGKVINTVQMSLNNEEKLFESLPVKTADGKVIDYSFEQTITPDKYNIKYDILADLTTITDIHRPDTVSLSLTKVWNDKDNADNIRPDSINVDLLADGVKQETYTVGKDTNWQVTTSVLPKYKDGKEIKYEWKEQSIDGYTSSMSVNGYDTTLTNSHMPKYKVVTKIDHGTITPTEEDIEYGSDRKIEYKPDEGCYVDEVTVDGVKVDNDSSYNFGNITADHEIIVKTKPYHVITTKIDHGIITDKIEKIKDNEDKGVSWTPATGYYVTKVTVDGEEIYNSNKVSGYPTSQDFNNITADHDVVVETKKIPVLSITKESDKTVYNCDDTVVYTITAKQTVEDAEATNVIISDKDVTKGLEFDLSTVKCNMPNAVITTEDNSFIVSIDKLSDKDTLIVTVEGKVNTDTLDSADIKNTATIKSDQTEEINDDADISIDFNIVTRVVNGTIDESIMDIPYGESKKINYRANDGYYLSQIKVDGKVVDKNKYKESYDFDNIKANHLIEVEYAPYYKITTKIDHGTIVDDILNIRSGENKKVKWKPAEGYYVSKIIVDNVVTYEGNDYSKYPENYDFDNITANHNVIVETKKMTYKIETEVINGTITDNRLDIPYGESRVIKYSPNKGYKIASIFIDGKEIEITDENSFECAFNDIRDNHNIKVVYSKIPSEKVSGVENETPVKKHKNKVVVERKKVRVEGTAVKYVAPKTGRNSVYKTFLPISLMLILLCFVSVLIVKHKYNS